MRGPAGGYIYYAKAAYDADAWRFLEAAPTDFSYNWTTDYITAGFVVNDGNVYTDVDSSTTYTVGDTLLLSKTDFYWGPAGSSGTTPPYTYNTTAPLGKGTDNFAILDALTTVTPKLRDLTGRRVKTLDNNPRRDTPNCLHAAQPGGFDDWFIPSLTELGYLYTNRSKVGGLAADVYWSSTEDLTDAYSTLDASIPAQIPNASAVDFSTGATVEITRDTVNLIRPSRRF